jgi:hypothetical protein
VLIAPVVTRVACVQLEQRVVAVRQLIGACNSKRCAPEAATITQVRIELVSSASYLLTENGLGRKGRPFPKTGSVERGREFHSAHPLLNDSKTAQNRTTVSNDRSGKTPFQGYYNAGQGRIGRGFLRVLGCEDRCDFSADPARPPPTCICDTRHGIIGISVCGVRQSRP